MNNSIAIALVALEWVLAITLFVNLKLAMKKEKKRMEARKQKALAYWRGRTEE